MSQILLIRHAEPSLRGVILGAADPPLSATGRGQARELAHRLTHASPVAAIYTSPLRRALQTAAHLLWPWRPCTVLRDLREISYGPWDGLTWEQISALDPDLADRKGADWLGVEIPGAELWAAFEERVARAFRVIQSGPLPAAVVAHQAVNAHIAHLLGGGSQTEFQQAYAEVLTHESQSDHAPHLDRSNLRTD